MEETLQLWFNQVHDQRDKECHNLALNLIDSNCFILTMFLLNKKNKKILNKYIIYFYELL